MLVTNNTTDKSFEAEPELDIISSAIRHNFQIGYSCRQGVCGSCSASITSGTYSVIGGSAKTCVSACGSPQKVLLCRVVPHSDITIEHTPPSAVNRHAAQIESIVAMTDDIVRLTLRIISGKAFEFEPGQFIAIRWLGSQLKYFSIATAPGDSESIELHIRKQGVGGFTQWLFDSATTDDVIGVEGPLGNFGWKTPPERPVIMIATGTGFSPVKSLIEGHWLWEHAPGVYFYWGGRYKTDLYQDELACAWSAESSHFKYIPVLTRESPSVWQGRTGRIPASVLQDHPDLSGFDVYACGSPEMIADAKEMFVHIGGLPAERFYADAFESTGRASNKPIVSFDVEFAKSPLHGRVRAEVGVSLLEALKNSGLNLDHYCGGGAVCATCRVNVIATGIEKPEETEADLLECLVDLSAGDRLACQMVVTEALDSARVRLPGSPSHISRLED